MSFLPRPLSRTNVEMRSKRGPGALLLAALLITIAIWFLPVNSAAADILLLITSGTHKTTQTEAYETRTYGRLPTLRTVSLEETNVPHVSDAVTDFFREDNLTLSAAWTHYPVTPDSDISSTKSPDSPGTAADLTSDVQTDPGSTSGTDLHNQTHFYPTLYLVDKRSVTSDITADVEETDKTVCDSGPNHSEVLAIVLGAVFLTMLISK
ncbi:hypothetical protein GDO78_007573 [Eleutherodactylus coqui]|uniref:Uncharacterized protein n=1 Tax=Eleutherodactylus coqui TaxID=57060 RepID=A0A8J6FID2_ELECQ|nr:hypothetical protein GDO78_007573 [Eleutherodactylus coqui]